MKVFSFILCFFVFFPAYAQEGTNFETFTLNESLQKANAEKKKVFIDCYTSWCGPCKEMADQVFPLPEIGQFLNSHCICVKFDMEKGEGKELAQKYNIISYPTFLLLKPDGTEIYRLVGSQTPAEFIVKLTQAVKADNNMSLLEKRFERNDLLPEELLNYILLLLDANLYSKAIPATEKLFSMLPEADKTDPKYWPLYTNYLLSSLTSPQFIFLVDHIAEFKNKIGKQKVNDYLYSLYNQVLQTYISGYLKDKNGHQSQTSIEILLKQVKKLHLSERQNYLIGKTKLAQARCENNINKMITLAKKLLQICPPEEVWPLATFFLTLQTDAPNQLKKLETLKKEFIAALPDKKMEGFIQYGFKKKNLNSKP